MNASDKLSFSNVSMTRVFEKTRKMVFCCILNTQDRLNPIWPERWPNSLRPPPLSAKLDPQQKNCTEAIKSIQSIVYKRDMPGVLSMSPIMGWGRSCSDLGDLRRASQRRCFPSSPCPFSSRRDFLLSLFFSLLEVFSFSKHSVFPVFLRLAQVASANIRRSVHPLRCHNIRGGSGLVRPVEMCSQAETVLVLKT